MPTEASLRRLRRPRGRARGRARPRRTRGRAAPAGSGRDLNSGWNCDATNHGWSGSSTISTSRPSWNVPLTTSPRVDELLAVGVVHLVAVAVALGDHRLAAVDLARARPSASSTACAPRRIVPPRSSTSFCSGSRSITGNGVSGSISVELAPSRPHDVARELGDRDVHAEADAEVRDLVLARDAAGEDLALPPARAEAAGDEHAVDARSSARASSSVMSSASTQRTCTRQPLWMPACFERLVHREVGVVQLHVLADERDLDRLACAR